MKQPLALYINPVYFRQLAKMRGFHTVNIGSIPVIEGHYTDYRNLVKINGIFSNRPNWAPDDRTGFIKTPIKHFQQRPWMHDNTTVSLDVAMKTRAQQIESQGQTINIMWSGGIDSTAMTNAFIANIKDLKQLRVLYSPFSEYEHRTFLHYMQNLGVDTVDISGTVYLDTYFDGIFVIGHGGDEMNASIDESFINEYGFETLDQPWQDFFWKRTEDQALIEFSEKYFSRAGIDIETVLQARWFFYANSKIHSLLAHYNQFCVDYPNYHKDLMIGFYDCDIYQSYISNNLQDIMPTPDYRSFKQNLKDYCVKLDGIKQWHKNKTKVGSSQLSYYMSKKIFLKNLHSLMILEDGSRVHIQSLPWFSAKEFSSKYGQTLDYLWNDTD